MRRPHHHHQNPAAKKDYHQAQDELVAYFHRALFPYLSLQVILSIQYLSTQLRLRPGRENSQQSPQQVHLATMLS